MPSAHFQEQYSAGTAIPTGTASALNPRMLNMQTSNGIPGVVFNPATGITTINAPGGYELVAESATSDYESVQTQIVVVGGGAVAIGLSSADHGGGPTSQSTKTSTARGSLRVDGPVQVQVLSWVGPAITSTSPTLCPVTGAAVDVGAHLAIHTK
jgi:hypothetical protein